MNINVEPVFKIKHLNRLVLTFILPYVFALEICDEQFSALFKIGANYTVYSFKRTMNKCFIQININMGPMAFKTNH